MAPSFAEAAVTLVMRRDYAEMSCVCDGMAITSYIDTEDE